MMMATLRNVRNGTPPTLAVLGVNPSGAAGKWGSGGYEEYGDAAAAGTSKYVNQLGK
jgi:hypothetical protein